MGQARKKSRPFSASATSNPRDVSGSVRFAIATDGSSPPAVAHAPAGPAATSSGRPPSGTPPGSAGPRSGCAPCRATGRRAGPPAPCRWFPGKGRLVSQGAHRSVVPSAFAGTCASAGTAGRNRFVPGWPARASGGTPYPAPEPPEKSDQPRRPRPVSTASRETPARVASGCPEATPASGRSRWIPGRWFPAAMRWRERAHWRPAAPEAAAPPARSPMCSGRRQLAEASLRPAAR
jgi:hypothetical protein